MRDLFHQFLLIREWKVKVFLRQNWRPNCRSWQVFLNKIEDYFFRRDRYFLRCGVKKRRYKENFKKDSRKTAVDRTLWIMEEKVGSKGGTFVFVRLEITWPSSLYISSLTNFSKSDGGRNLSDMGHFVCCYSQSFGVVLTRFWPRKVSI